MSRPVQFRWLWIVVGTSAWLVLCGGGETTSAADRWDHYRVLMERNIFVRERTRGRERRFTTSRPVGVIDTDGNLVLTGTAQQGGKGVAFVKDTRSGQTANVRTGGSVGKGKLVTITLDYVVYEYEGVTRRIKIGSNLAGVAVRRGPTTMSASTGPSTAPVGKGAGEAVDSNAAAILERMRRRRAQELTR